MSATTTDAEELWPDLFIGLTAEERARIGSTLGSMMHEGYVPKRHQIADLTAYVRGDIDAAEYDRRAIARAMAPQAKAV